MLILKRSVDLWRDESGSELAEYALVLTCFTLIGMVAVQLLAHSSNANVETNETTYTGAFVNGY